MARYLAGKVMTLQDGRTAQIGDPVPEAKTWPNLAMWIRSGHIVEAEDRPGPEAGPKPKRKAKAKKTEA